MKFSNFDILLTFFIRFVKIVQIYIVRVDFTVEIVQVYVPMNLDLSATGP